MRGARMTGIDLSSRLIEAARAAEIAEPLGIEYHVGPFADLKQFPNESFDAAISTMAFMDGPGLFTMPRVRFTGCCGPAERSISASFIPVSAHAARAG